MDFVTCDLCGNNDTTLVSKSYQSGIELTNVICRKCTLIYLNPRLNADEYREFYAARYRQMYCGSATPTAHTRREIDSRASHICRWCQPYLRPGARVLEIGCGTGAVLAHLRDQFGCVVEGIEPSTDYQAFAESHYGLSVFCGTLDEYMAHASAMFDVIIMAHVLEHFPSPRAALNRVTQLLTENGVMYIEVPNVLFHHSFEVAHPYSFHAQSLNRLLALTGFQALDVIIHGLPRYRHIPYFLSVVARKAPPHKPDLTTVSWRDVLNARRRGRRLAGLVEFPERGWGVIVNVLRRVLSDQAYARLKSWHGKLRR